MFIICMWWILNNQNEIISINFFFDFEDRKIKKKNGVAIAEINTYLPECRSPKQEMKIWGNPYLKIETTCTLADCNASIFHDI